MVLQKELRFYILTHKQQELNFETGHSLSVGNLKTHLLTRPHLLIVLLSLVTIFFQTGILETLETVFYLKKFIYVVHNILLNVTTFMFSLPLFPSAIRNIPWCLFRGLIIFFKVTYFLVCLFCFLLPACYICVPHACSVTEVRKVCSIPWNWCYRWLWAAIGVQGINTKFSGRTASLINC